MNDEIKKEVEQTTDVKESIPVDATVSVAPEETYVIETESSDDDDFESQEGLWAGKTKYEIPNNADKFIDSKNETVIDKEELTPFQIIKAIAKQNNYTIKDPNKSCNKCYGRGYEGLDSETKMPIPCRCLFRGKSENEKVADMIYDMKKNPGKINRLQRRRIAKGFFKQFKTQRRIINQLKRESDRAESTKNQEKSYIDNILKTYKEVKSLRKAAKKLNITLTELKKIIKENRFKNETHIKE